MKPPKPNLQTGRHAPVQLDPAVKRRNVRTAVLLLLFVGGSLLAFFNNFGAFR